MSWNYRVIKRCINGIKIYEVHEVYYNSDGSISSWTENSIIPTGESIEELRQDFSRQLLAFENPILDYDKLLQDRSEKR